MPQRYRGLNRRSDTRPANPACTICKAPTEKVRRTVRTPYLVYFKCTQCGHIMSLELPKR